MFSNPSVSVIIPNFNGKGYLSGCLNSLDHQSYGNFDIIVVDNGSTDGTVEFIKNRFPCVKIIENKVNLGFSKAVNQGAYYSKSDYVIFLNNDTEADPKWLEELVNFAVAQQNFGACQSKILLFKNKELINTIGNEIFFLGHGWSGGYGKPKDAYDKIREVTYCSGASMMIKKSVLEKTGYFDDEEVFMYHDDLDLGWRLLLYGYNNYLVPESIVYHKYNYNRNNKKYYLLEVSRQICIIKYYSLKTIMLLLPAFIAMEAGIILLSIREKWFKDKLKSYCYIIKNFNRLLAKRRRIQKNRVRTDKEILQYFKGEIAFGELNNKWIGWANPFFKTYWQVIKIIA